MLSAPGLMKKIELAYTNSQGHYPALDGLRGTAILGVLAFHVLEMPAGWMGVDLFFVISGFLISSILIDTRADKYYFRNFYIKRTFRIFPLYYTSLILITVLFACFGISLGKYGWTYFLYLQNFPAAFAHFWPDGWNASLNHFWSLAIEEQFYLAFPLFIYLIRPRLLPWICLGGIIASLAFRFYFYQHHNQLATYVFTLSRMDSLLFGSLAAWFARHYKRIGTALIWIPLLMLVFVLFVSTDLRHPVYQTVGFTVTAFFFSVVILVALSPQYLFSRILQWEPLRKVGKISYGLYIFHYPLLIIFQHLFQASPHQKIWIVTATLPTSFLLAFLSFYYFEKRWMEWRKSFLR